MHWILLMSLVVLISGCAGAGEPKHIPRFAFDRHESPLNLPLTLRVRSVSPPPVISLCVQNVTDVQPGEAALLRLAAPRQRYQ